jgi:hypothetical protein
MPATIVVGTQWADEILAKITGDDGTEDDPLEVLADIEDLVQRLVEGVAVLVVALDAARDGR